jgi:hypothetical protein
MRRSESEKAADALIAGAGHLNWNPQLFVGVIMAASPAVQRMIMYTVKELVKVYLENARDPHLRYRTDPVAQKYAEEAESLDLTEFDQPW